MRSSASTMPRASDSELSMLDAFAAFAALYLAVVLVDVACLGRRRRNLVREAGGAVACAILLALALA